MKNALVYLKEKEVSSFFTHMMMGALLALSYHPYTMLFVLLFSCFSYNKGFIQYFIYVVSLVSACVVMNNTMVVIYLAFTIFVLLCRKAYQYLKMDALPVMKYWNTTLLLFTSYLLYNDLNTTLVLGLSCFLLHHFLFLEKVESNKRDIWVFLISSIFYLLCIQEKIPYQEYYTIFYLCFITYFLNFEICGLVFLYFSFFEIPVMYLLYLLFVNYTKEKKYLYSFFSLFFLLYDASLTTLLLILSCLVFGLFSVKEEDSFLLETQEIEKEHQMYMEHSFYRQLMNYSSVFYNLANYYAEQDTMQSQVLERMGDALEYNAKMSKHYFHKKEELKQRVEKILNGYKFQVVHCACFEEDDKIRIELDLLHLYEKEIEEVIIPLLDKVSGTRLHLCEQKQYSFQKDKVKITLESEEYLQVQTYGNSLHVREMCGDSFQTFQLQDSVVCMLSDGMGQGKSAKKTSGLLIQIMETMIRCNIPQVECVKLINRFLRSDVFATLDVLSFDRKANVAYLSKSASAPTFLLRNEKLYEMSAHSLPIGIVDHIQADVYEVAFQKNDVFIMMSDGVQKSEIEKWVGLKRCQNVKNEGINMMNIISDKKRFDDSTILLAKVS